MTQPPVRYENYPPDDSPAPVGWADEDTPIVRPYVPASIPAPPARPGTSRRTLIGLVIGVPVAGILLSAMIARSNDNGGSGSPEDPDYYDGGVSGGQTIEVGDYSASVPENWTMTEDGTGAVEVANGDNRLTAVAIDTGSATTAVEEIARLAKGHYSGFTGKIDEPVDRSTADLQHATMDGTGKFNGLGARLLTELWIDDSGTGLLVSRVLTSPVSTGIPAEALAMLQELSGNF